MVPVLILDVNISSHRFEGQVVKQSSNQVSVNSVLLTGSLIL